MNLQGRNLQQGLTGDDVRLLHAELAQLNLLVSDDERAGALFGPLTLAAVQQFQKQHALPITGVVDPATAAAINAALNAQPAPTFTVSGRVYSGLSAGVGGLKIQAVDKNAGPDVLLATAVTDDHGAYSVQYSPAAALQQGKAAPDIQVRAFTDSKLVGASEVRYNAAATETLDIVVPDIAAGALASEYATLTDAIAAHYKGRLADLQESGDRSDITYLANKIEVDARAVALRVLADQFSARTAAAGGAAPDIAPAFFYALFRAGLPANEDILYRTDAKTLETIWTKAAQQGVIPGSIVGTIPDAVKKFQVLCTQKLLSGPALAGVSSLKDMLVSASLTEEQQQQFATLYAANRTDMAAFWKAVGIGFGQDIAARLQLDGKLAFLTINNAPLMQALRGIGGAQGLSDPVQLAQAGYHRAAKWAELLNANTPIPNEIPGDTPEAKRTNYAEFLAAQVRLSYPTAAVAEIVKSGDLPVSSPDQVRAFLTEHQGKFEIGVQPVEQYIARNQLQVAPDTVTQIKRLQRIYQIAPADQAMHGLLNNKIDAAYHVVQYDREAFVDTFGPQLGGTDAAIRIYDRSVQVHGAVLNVAMSYLMARTGIQLGASPMAAGATEPAGPPTAPAMAIGGQILRPAPTGPAADNVADVVAYPTLERLFGSMDFCTCDACRSMFSPAAYLVDLLLFIDKAAEGKENAQAVLLARRPDIQYLPLTCENTNTALPYIDLVNETLEYYVANTVQPLSLKGYRGHDTDGTTSVDLLASPQFVMDSAYTILRGEWFPAPLPFHQPLETLRRYFNRLDVPLPLAMARLRQGDGLEAGSNRYGWRDILMEELGLSRQEYRLLTDGSLTLKQIYGFAATKTDNEVADSLSNAKQFARRLGIPYDDLISILKTRFVNPNSELIPKLAPLGVTFAAIQAVHDGTMSDADFLKLLPTGAAAPDPAAYGGDIVAWVKDTKNYARIMGIITLVDPSGSTDGRTFDKFELRYSKPVANSADTSTRLGTAEFVRLLRFIRLQAKTGWSIEHTDAAICALYRADLAPLGPDDIDTLAKLDAGFLRLLPRLGVAVHVMNLLGLNAQRDLPALLACWSDIGTHGDGALYAQLFTNAAIANPDAAFAADRYGEFLTGNEKLIAHAEALRGAFNLTGPEFDWIVAALGYSNTTPLTLSSISAIYRRGWLARRLRLSVRELLLLTSLTGIDPFAAPDIGAAPAPEPPIIRLISLVQALRDRSLKPASALYLIWNKDLSGRSAPDPAKVTEFARTLRGDFVSIDDQFAATEDPSGNILRARMTLVYGPDDTNAFFALLDGTIVFDTPYTHPAATLDPAIIAADANLAYDNFRHRLAHTGLLSSGQRNTLKLVPGVPSAFQTAVDALFARSQDIMGSFFSRYPELRPLYDAYVASGEPPEKKRTALLAAFQPELSRRRKREQALQRLSAATALDLDSTRTLLDPTIQAGAAYPLHAAGHSDQPVLNDVLALETRGLQAQFFFRDTATGSVDRSIAAAPDLQYSAASGNPLPTNPTLGATISGIWTGSVEVPETGYYNLVIETDTGAHVTLSFGGTPQPLTQNGTVWRNSNPLQLTSGTLCPIVLTVEKVKNALSVKWETPKRPREVIPGRYLYPPAILPPFREAYIRFLKTASLAARLGMTASEIAHFGTDPNYRINGDGWLNVLPATGDPPGAIAAALVKPLLAVLDFARIKANWSPDDERVLRVLQDPTAATADPDSLLFTLSFWERNSLNDVLAHFAGNIAGLAHFDLFRRVYEAFGPIRSVGIPAAKLIQATTNDPDGGTVRDFQAALRARYDTVDWRSMIQPINDAMRELQRDALVAYILHQLRENPKTAQIDTPDKLFEYFLMDVEMEACMQTSRIRHALSSVQLFIERSLMNLEQPRVSPKSIDASHWKWMKRYRLWEAARKVFLFPENWLEPELRDDKSPEFKEVESELLQSDITDDSAAVALLNYLAKLHDIAKLEPCGMYFEEGDAGAESNVVHVIARSSGAHRKYYYRRYETGYWTPWEQIKLDIEDNPVIPVVWRGRLLLFWLRLLKSGPDPATGPFAHKKFGELTNDNIPTNPPEVAVQAVLCWSEYYNGKWQPAKTSDIGQPLDLGQFPSTGSGALNRASLQLFSDELQDGLRITIFGAGATRQAFLLYNTHSLPLSLPSPSAPPPILGPFGKTRWFDTSNSTFRIVYNERHPDRPAHHLSRDVLSDPVPRRAVQPNHETSDVFNAPFFFEDRRHAFYVTSEEQQVWVGNFGGFGVTADPGVVSEPRISPLVIQPPPKPRPRPRVDGGPADPGVIDPAPMQRFVTEDAYIHWGFATAAEVTFGDRQIGPSGAISNIVKA
jgi:hypothetical protein